MSKVVLVDPVCERCVGLRSLLEYHGFEVECHETAEEFLQDLADGRIPDCLVVSLELFGMDGLELQEELLSIGHEIPVVFMAKDAGIQDFRRAVENGAIGWYEDDFSVRALLLRVQEATTGVRFSEVSYRHRLANQGTRRAEEPPMPENELGGLELIACPHIVF